MLVSSKTERRLMNLASWRYLQESTPRKSRRLVPFGNENHKVGTYLASQLSNPAKVLIAHKG